MSDDLISRETAIKAVAELQGRAASKSELKGISKAWKRIKALPSAQPNLDEWCRDCKEYDKERHSCPRWNRVIRHTVEDIKAEQPERKEGAWVLREDLYGSTEAKCSECGFEMLVNEEGNGLHEVSDLHYCPNCGADMRGDDHGTD